MFQDKEDIFCPISHNSPLSLFEEGVLEVSVAFITVKRIIQSLIVLHWLFVFYLSKSFHSFNLPLAL